MSSTRVKILNLLRSRPMTQSEIARALDLAKPTVKVHLDRLEREGLVARVESGRKWVYYKLTAEGARAVELRVAKLIVTLSAAMVSFLAGIYRISLQRHAELKTTLDRGVYEIATAKAAQIDPLGLALVIAAFLLTAIAIAAYARGE